MPKPSLLIYEVRDYTGAVSVHPASSPENAIQCHLIHYGLIQGLPAAPVVSRGYRLSELNGNPRQSQICCEKTCLIDDGSIVV